MVQILKADQAIGRIRPGMSVMIGGFLGVGTPESLVAALVEHGAGDLTVIVNDTAFPGVGVGRLQDSGQLKRLYVSYIGGHSETGKQMESGDLEVILTPQGTLAEQIRAGGAGLGGFLTPTGVGTVVSTGKQQMVVDGKSYLLEKPLKADVALIKAYRADKAGNLVYRASARNFNPLMAMAAEIVIVEAEEIVPVGTIDPEQVMTPGIFVNYLVQGGRGDE